MATVEITGAVTEGIEKALRHALLRRGELLVDSRNPEVVNKTRVHEALGAHYYADMWQGREDIAHRFMSQWLVAVSPVISWRIMGADGSTTIQLPQVRTERVFLVPRIEMYSRNAHTVPDNAELPDDVHKLCTEYAAAFIEHSEFAANAHSTMHTLLSSCRSLNEAVKKYPDLLMYVPTRYKERMEAKVVKGVKVAREVKPADAIDFSGLTTAAVIGALSVN